MQAAILLVYFSSNAWNTMLSITSVMVLPAYLASTLFLLKMCVTGDYGRRVNKGKVLALLSGAVGSLFGLFMFYAGGLQYVVMVPILLSIGVPIFIWSRREQRDGNPIFLVPEWIFLSVLLALSAVAIVLFWSGTLTI